MKTYVNQIKTTVIGIITIKLGVLYFVLPYLKEGLWESNAWVLLGSIIVGFGFIIAPDKIITLIYDKLVGLLFGWIKKKAE
jgi:hypothetical protein